MIEKTKFFQSKETIYKYEFNRFERGMVGFEPQNHVYDVNKAEFMARVCHPTQKCQNRPT